MKQGESWDKGERGEKTVGLFLQHHGWFVRNVNHPKQTEAPMFESLDDEIILPDFLVTKRREKYWVEVKTKQEPVFFRQEREQRHGMCDRHYKDYQRVEDNTDIPVWVFVVELDNDIICYNSLKQLEVVDTLDKNDSEGYEEDMVFFTRQSFNKVVAGAGGEDGFGQQELVAYENTKKDIKEIFCEEKGGSQEKERQQDLSAFTDGGGKHE